MSYLMNDQQKMNEIIFAKRNKSYGAYILRATYGNTVFRSLGFMSLTMAILLSLAFYSVNHREEIMKEIILPDNGKIHVTPVDLKPKTMSCPKAEQVASKPASSAASSAISTLISDTASVHTNTVMNESISTGTGSAAGTGSLGTSTGTTSNGTGTLDIGNDKKSPMYVADSSPEFEGGLTALYKYLGENLRYPEMAREVGKGGILHVQFIVDEQGNVKEPVLMNKLGFGLDEEALRVVNSIPRFKKPGIFKGQPVAVYYTLPIKFRLK